MVVAMLTVSFLAVIGPLVQPAVAASNVLTIHLHVIGVPQPPVPSYGVGGVVFGWSCSDGTYEAQYPSFTQDLTIGPISVAAGVTCYLNSGLGEFPIQLPETETPSCVAGGDAACSAVGPNVVDFGTAGSATLTDTVTWGASCPGTYLVGVRGSGQTNSSSGGYGPQVAAAIAAFKTRAPNRQVTSEFLDYQSNPVLTLLNPRNGVDQYLTGVSGGINTLENKLTAEHNACPTRPIVLFGYSQGALVVDRALVELDHAHSSVLNQVAGVGLIADPQRLGSASYNIGSASTRLNGLTRSLHTYPADDLPGVIYNRIASLCTANDQVCAFDPSFLLVGGPLAGLVWTARMAQALVTHIGYSGSAATSIGNAVSDKVSSFGA